MKTVWLLARMFAFGTLALAARTVPAASARSAEVAMSAEVTAPAQAQNPQPQTFIGQIARSDGKYVLRETSTNTTFMLDDQEKARLYSGKNVKVIGTENPGNKVIHVYNIQEA